MQRVLPIDPADVRALCINGATLAWFIVIPASAIATIEKSGFDGQMNELATQAALGAGEGRGGCSGAVHRRFHRLNGAIGEGPRGCAGLIFFLYGVQAGFLAVCHGSDILDALFRCQDQIAVLIQDRGVDHGLEQLSELD